MTPIRNERIKLTAAYLNAAAGSLFTAGVAAPLAAAVFGFAGTGSALGPLTLMLGVTIFLAGSVALHVAARIALKGLEP